MGTFVSTPFFSIFDGDFSFDFLSFFLVFPVGFLEVGFEKMQEFDDY